MSNDFSTSIWECMDDTSSCCLGCFCPWVLHCNNATLIEGRSDCCRQCLCYFTEFNIRQTIRRRKNYEYNCVGDCCTLWCCHDLAQCQHNRELKKGNGIPLPGEGYAGFIVVPKNKTQDNQTGDQTIVVNVNAGYAPPPQGYAPPPPQGYAPPLSLIHI